MSLTIKRHFSVGDRVRVKDTTTMYVESSDAPLSSYVGMEGNVVRVYKRGENDPYNCLVEFDRKGNNTAFGWHELERA